jgi:hypothetical protein
LRVAGSNLRAATFTCKQITAKSLDTTKTIARAFPADCCGVSEHNNRQTHFSNFYIPGILMRGILIIDRRALSCLKFIFLQFDNDDIRIRIPDVFADVYMPVHPDNTPCFDVNFMRPTIRKCQTPLE